MKINLDVRKYAHLKQRIINAMYGDFITYDSAYRKFDQEVDDFLVALHEKGLEIKEIDAPPES